MIGALLSFYKPSFPKTIVYMLQSTEYKTGPYLKWFWRTNDFSKVSKRRQLDQTRAAKLLLLALSTGMAVQAIVGLILLGSGINGELSSGVEFGLAIFLSYPIVWAHLVVVPLELGRNLIIKPKQKKLINNSQDIFTKHQAIKIAVAGSYGKTSMKELLVTVLGEGKKVAATPANRNVASSHAEFAKKLKGDEDILIIEYGEGKPGDVEGFTATTHPDMAIVTGVAPAHLDEYESTDQAAKDIFSVSKDLKPENVFVNKDSARAGKFIKPGLQTYSADGVMGWKVGNVKLSIDGTSFKLSKGRQSLQLKSGLLGKHQIGPLALAAALAHKFGMTKNQIEKAITKTGPFEHRMKPRALHGAWIIDDTYNGNIEGIKAGLELLKTLPAKRKVYISPGLVGQGDENEEVHKEMGALIAKTSPDEVVLMNNSVTDFIKQGLSQGKFNKKLTIQKDPLYFYQNLDQFVAAGDLVLMQNDWPDIYN